ncbi:dihydrofolate reductase family protein [Nostocoides sp. HKS02]|uniref:RibD family protein n=1 Tax=Nostocoides sp. HKS02 TaxID=1813880 RepID=UPI0012B4B979|nr:dihydrofolate reductase family protein [Tetrasphaera sp. HKS02]QGN57240.1 deaminase [Tetrasphaera sp. HKS02]
MAERPYTVLSCGISIDGYLDDASPTRLVLSNAADLDRVDAERARCDAILVGAATIRTDNPRLLVRSPARQADRTARGLSATPTKVTVTTRGDLDPAADFFATGPGDKLVYAAGEALVRARRQLGSVATVVDAGERDGGDRGSDDPVDLARVAADLHDRGVGRLMVEGGGRTLTQFLTGDLADELALVVAPLFVGDPRGARFVGAGQFPWNADRRAELAEVRQIGDVVLLRYALSARFERE